ncbi:CAP-associated domain-containing protein [Enterococcus sp. LJL128]|uniref:CAP-associated domain-containing protein n=1 Tax=Enterococcus sp. LJL51 TaxID=3416656 RepID=UPI003CFB6321
MRRYLAFFAVLFSVFVIGYLEPVFFPSEKAEVTVNQNGRQNVSHTALPHEELPASGFSLYIGKNSTDFVKEFGEPLTKYDTGLGYELWTFGEEDSEYMELSVSNGKIAAVKAFNDTENTAPFDMGMNLSDISELTTIYSNFDIEYNQETFSIELMEEDMNYRPMIAFDNDTFAILFFTHGKDVLSGVVYLSKEYLLTVMPYQLAYGQSLAIPIGETSAESIDEKQKTMTRTINFLRIKEELPAYAINPAVERNAEYLYASYEEYIADILTVERLEALSQVKSESLGAISSSFAFTKKEYETMIAKSSLTIQKPAGAFMTPVYDPSFTALFWFSDGAYYLRFASDKNEDIGIAFSKEDVLVLLQTIEKNTDETEESG